MKVTLISPKVDCEGSSLLDFKYLVQLLGGKIKTNCLPLALPTLAALTPTNIEVDIIDENIEPINYDKKVDLVGITFFTFLAPRAYRIADEFRRRGVKVVLGGIHASMLPEEASLHADIVIIGEAEEVWPAFIKDLCEGKSKTLYHSANYPQLDKIVIPRWDLVKSDAYQIFNIQSTRGCPFDCDFCSVRAFNGRGIRHKPIENVIKEIEALKELTGRKAISIVDDNLTADRKYAKDLFKALIPLKIKWLSQASIDVAGDEELLELAAQSGATHLLVGFESVSQESLNSVNKGKVNKVENYLSAIEKIHSYGIAVFGSFILGLDCDDDTVFEKTANFVNNSDISSSIFSILTPPPGTRLFNRLEDEKRILHKRWEEYHGGRVCFTPKLMSPKMLQEGYYWTLQKVYSISSSFKRLERVWKKNLLKRDKITVLDKSVISLKLIKGLLCRNINMIRIVVKTIKSLWRRNVDIGSILMNLSFYVFANQYPKIKYLRRSNCEKEVKC